MNELVHDLSVNFDLWLCNYIAALGRHIVVSCTDYFSHVEGKTV